MIPGTVDPTRPIDSELVLEFNTRSERARAEVAELVSETWAQSPLVLFTEVRGSRSPASKSVKELLKPYALLPRPVIFDVDQRTDEAVLRPLLFRLTSSKSLPIVIVGGKVMAAQELVTLDASGDLTDVLEAAGAVVDGLPGKFRKQAP
ncbi:hypothetical protein BS47DRAFT_1323840 [Hydnum rufescens UP504]|uniref:Uncharacterized protein n=1 Tax=Hydnum rufescens UP504 TaxID=1448309 RepID=A0A9P6DZA2_9AGAM|nr:hypothetical protein BS47DRAFT_1323840 [Hydnum rufescens UP504]